MTKTQNIALVFAVSSLIATAANASPVTYEFSFTAEDVLSYSFANGADGSTAADTGLFNGARRTQNDGTSTGSWAGSFLQSEHSAFENWATSTGDKLTTLNLWGFNDGLGEFWGEDFKHSGREMINGPGNWVDWTNAGWDPGWGPNPNPYTDVTAGWFAIDIADGLGFGDAGLASQEFRFQMSFNTDDWSYGADTNGAPNTLGGPMTFWFGGFMGDANNLFQYIYEGNLVLTGTLQGAAPAPVPLPTTLMLLCAGLIGMGIFRRRRA